jgi:hypothetical protein
MSGVGVLDKAVVILAACVDGASLAELVDRTKLPRATAHRLAQALEIHRMLVRDTQGRWRPGPRLGELANAAPDVLLTRCSHELVGEETRALTEGRRTEILATNDELAGEALRTLGVAFRSLPKDGSGREGFDENVEHELVFLGLIGMIDPPRREARDAVVELVRAHGGKALDLTAATCAGGGVEVPAMDLVVAVSRSVAPLAEKLAATRDVPLLSV